MEGVSVYFYDWREGPPDEVLNLEPVVKTVLPSLNHTWAGKPDDRMKSDKYVAEFVGFLKIDVEGEYKFLVKSYGGVKFLINNNSVIDSWILEYQKIKSKGLYLGKGYHRFRLLYCNPGRYGEIRIKWKKPTGEVEDIPRAQLYFTIGEHVFFTGLPDNFTVVLTPTLISIERKTCISINDVCMIKIEIHEQPFESLVSVYNEKNQPVYRATQPLLIWGGDVYRFQVLVKKE